ncbi:MAG: helix-turn-helix transcriptional regulator [Dehalococcoidia bacterium]|nr:helix-turn-helix transcriptional regulator [Dehalococcoidia bacterium]
MERKKRKSTYARTGPGKHETGSHDFLTDPLQAAAGTGTGRSLGDRVRNVREARGLTLKDVSDRTGIDVHSLKRIESNQDIPPLGQLVKLGKALEMKMGYFVSPGLEKPVTVIRADQRKPSARHRERKEERHGYSYESLAPEKANRLMEPFIVTLSPTGTDELSTHDGQEFIFVLEGQVVARVGDQAEYLGPGDAVYYDSTQPHSVRCAGKDESKILAVIYAG